MSQYYKYQFISPEGMYATVKEELKSYFDTGAIDDLMFPTYLNKCLNKLGRTTYTVLAAALYVEDFEARLPDNFFAVREAWMCAEMPLTSFRSPTSFYSQSGSCETIQISPLLSSDDLCGATGECPSPICPEPEICGGCVPKTIQAVFKTNGEIERAYTQLYMLRPGTISAKNKCDLTYSENWRLSNPFGSEQTSFDIRDNSFVTNFREGIVHMQFYAEDYDESGNQMIPDNFRIKEYIEAFLKYKMFETLYNQINDETFNQIEKKLINYKRQSDEAFILARNETLKKTPQELNRMIEKGMSRHNMYKLSNSSRKRSRRF